MTNYTLQAIGQRLRTQDSRTTRDTQYAVQVYEEGTSGIGWMTEQIFFTQAGAEDYIQRNRRNWKRMRVCITSGFDNPEWQAARDLLMNADTDVHEAWKLRVKAKVDELAEMFEKPF